MNPAPDEAPPRKETPDAGRATRRMDRIMRLPEVLGYTGISVATLYRWMQEGLFPKQVQLGPNAVGWRESVIASWIEGRKPVDAATDPVIRGET